MNNDKNYRRKYVTYGFTILIFVVFIIRLFYLQVIDKTYRENAESNAIYRQTIYPTRGLIYDRNGELLVTNQSVYDISVIVNEIDKNFDTIAFCNISNITIEDFRLFAQSVRKDRKRNNNIPHVLVAQLSSKDIAPLQESLYRFPGVYIVKRTLRDYPYDCACHILGYIGEVSQNEIEKSDYYSLGDYIGKSGIEKSHESLLRGEKGVECLARDSRGRIKGSYRNGENDKNATSGKDIMISLDLQLQLLAEKLLTNKVGSVVAIEPSTGEVLALVSSPNWSPKQLVGNSRASYNQLQNDVNRPLLNRATQAQYSPGSTFKPMMALFGLNEGVITPKTKYPCNGRASTPIRCTHFHHAMPDVGDALEQSCNPFFWQLFRDFLSKRKRDESIRDKFTKWYNYARDFGFGQIFAKADILEQAKGSVPSVETYDKIYHKNWNAYTVKSLSIGQGELLVTPLQLANFSATIANEGFYITPHLLKENTMKWEKHQCLISDTSYYHLVKNGMKRVMLYGTGKWYHTPLVDVCGKTGTVENIHGKDHAVFIGFAPQENPQIAIAVVVENAGFGATWACPIASLLMEQYLTKDVSRTWIVERIANTDLINN